MRRPELVLAVLVACKGDCPPPEVVGHADPQVLGTARRAVDAFFDRLPEGSDVCVPKVKVGTIRRDAGGWYWRVSRRIKIAKDAPLPYIEETAFHELCHAADFQLGLRSIDDRELWSFAADTELPAGRRRTAREAFASVCQIGPYGYDLLAHTCPQDDPHFAEMAAWLADVYGAPQTRALELVPVAQTPAEDVASIEVWSGGSVHIETATGGFDVDLFTGEPLAEPLGHPLEVWTYDTVHLDARVPSSLLYTLGHGVLWQPATGGMMFRIVTDEGVGCTASGEYHHDPDGRLLVFERNHGVLSWSRYEPSP